MKEWNSGPRLGKGINSEVSMNLKCRFEATAFRDRQGL